MICLFMHLFGDGRTAGDPRQGRGGTWPNRDNPRDILDRRYANGVITREQYQELKQSLKIPEITI